MSVLIVMDHAPTPVLIQRVATIVSVPLDMSFCLIIMIVKVNSQLYIYVVI